jgi:uncharacterized protein YutE (UPF0331/DUF86 family)
LSVCEELSKAILDLSVKATEAQMAKGVDPKEIKRQLEALIGLAREMLERSGCTVDLEKLRKLVDEADEDAEELEETVKLLKQQFDK